MSRVTKAFCNIYTRQPLWFLLFSATRQQPGHAYSRSASFAISTAQDYQPTLRSDNCRWRTPALRTRASSTQALRTSALAAPAPPPRPVCTSTSVRSRHAKAVHKQHPAAAGCRRRACARSRCHALHFAQRNPRQQEVFPVRTQSAFKAHRPAGNGSQAIERSMSELPL